MKNLVRSVSESHHHSHLHLQADPSPCSQYGSFMDLLGLQDLSPYSSLLDDMFLQVPPPTNPASSVAAAVDFNLPATPNASSISSGSSEAVVIDEVQVKPADEEEEDQVYDKDDDDEDQPKTQGAAAAAGKMKKKNNKEKKKKREREQRFAFMTKSEVDHLEDGYRWRKYGQKAVKNSPFPRSYYRCTSASCNVKKRVERSYTDPTTVVTTYEGQHNHPSPLLMPRSAALIRAATPTFTGSSNMLSVNSLMLPRNSGVHGQFLNNPNYDHYPVTDSLGGFPMLRNIEAASDNALVRKRRVSGSVAGFVGDDDGLLQDVVPSHVLKEE